MSHSPLQKELKKHFGFSDFKGLQEPVIKNLLEGKNSFVIMPTGGGKSLCYQLPALVSSGTAIVVSPLIALMKNQVDAIRGISYQEGIAHVLNSSLTKTAIQQVKKDIIDGVTKEQFNRLKNGNGYYWLTYETSMMKLLYIFSDAFIDYISGGTLAKCPEPSKKPFSSSLLL